MKSKKEKKLLQFTVINEPQEIQSKKFRVQYLDEDKKIIYGVNSFKNKKNRIIQSINLNQDFDYIQNDDEISLNENDEIIQEQNESEKSSSDDNKQREDNFLRYYDANFQCAVCHRQKNKMIDACLFCQPLCYYCLSENHIRSSCVEPVCLYCKKKHLKHKCDMDNNHKYFYGEQGLFSRTDKDFQHYQNRQQREIYKAVCLMCGKEGHFSCQMNMQSVDQQQDDKFISLFDKQNRTIEDKLFVKNKILFQQIFEGKFNTGILDNLVLNFNMSEYVLLEVPFFVVKCLKKQQGIFLRQFKNQYQQQNPELFQHQEQQIEYQKKKKKQHQNSNHPQDPQQEQYQKKEQQNEQYQKKKQQKHKGQNQLQNQFQKQNQQQNGYQEQFQMQSQQQNQHQGQNNQEQCQTQKHQQNQFQKQNQQQNYYQKKEKFQNDYNQQNKYQKNRHQKSQQTQQYFQEQGQFQDQYQKKKFQGNNNSHRKNQKNYKHKEKDNLNYNQQVNYNSQQQKQNYNENFQFTNKNQKNKQNHNDRKFQNEDVIFVKKNTKKKNKKSKNPYVQEDYYNKYDMNEDDFNNSNQKKNDENFQHSHKKNKHKKSQKQFFQFTNQKDESNKDFDNKWQTVDNNQQNQQFYYENPQQNNTTNVEQNYQAPHNHKKNNKKGYRKKKKQEDFVYTKKEQFQIKQILNYYINIINYIYIFQNKKLNLNYLECLKNINIIQLIFKINNMQKYIITLLFVFTFIKCECGPGCIKCNAQGACDLCDINLAMTLKEGKCVEENVSGCEVYGQNSKCLLCLPNHFLDSGNNKCVKVEKEIDECLYYSSDTQCSLCKSRFYTIGSECIEVFGDIPNCQYWHNSAECVQCEQDYVLTVDRYNCMKLSENKAIRNCMIYSNMVCTECKENYIFNKNLYIENTFKNFDIDQFSLFISRNLFPQLSQLVEQCQPIEVENCLVHKNAQTCTRCQNGYFLEAGKCIKNPFPQIQNCMIYKSHDKCVQCVPNFYLVEETSCKQVPENSQVQNCSINTASECKLCQDGFYLKSNICNENPVIENCEIYHKTDAFCAQCAFGFILTNDKKKCLAEIPNCVNYEPSTEGDQSLLCSKCTNGNYLTAEKQCTQGSIANCKDYDGTGQTCTECMNTFYLINQECKPHDVLTFCTQYSSTTKNECTQCEANHFLFKINTGCYKATDIVNCLEYSSKTDCSKCVLGFYLENNACVQIPLEENCLERNPTEATKCQICKIGYYLNSQRKCEKIYQFQQTSCKIAEGELDNYYKCQQCDPLYFFIELESDSAICMQSDRITTNINIADCTAYVYDVGSNVYKCKNCSEKFITETSSNDMQACQAECTATNQTNIELRFDVTQSNLNDTNYNRKQIKFDGYKGKTCKTEDNDTNCKQTVIANDGSKVCAVLKSNSTKVPQLRRLPGQDSSLGYQDKFNKIEKHGYTIPTFTFFNESIDYSFPVFQDVGNFCESFYQTQQTNIQTQQQVYTYYCDSCKFGKTGNIKLQSSYDYVSCDVDIAGCSSKQYGGLEYDYQSYRTHLVNSSLFRCHECANSDEIPFIHLPLNNSAKWTSEEFKPYGLDLASTKPSSSGNKNGDLISCRAPTATGLVIPENDFTKQFPGNCALGLYNIDVDKSYRLDTPSHQLSVYCLECAPGYQKKLNVDNQVSSCELIEHCNSSSINQFFNACAQCEYGFTWSYNIDSKKINFDECVQNPIKNCLVTDGQKCVYCKQGFYLENDYKCNQLKVDKCNVFNNTKQNFYQIFDTDDQAIQIQFSFGLYLSQNQDGCQICEQGYTLITTPDLELKQCVSSFNVSNDDLLDSNYLIDNCEIYTGYEKSCQRCKVGYLPNEDRTKCLSSINFPHCIQMKTQSQVNTCMDCEDDFYLVEGKCVKGDIEHCMKYENDKIPAECIECASGMRPSRDNFSCIQGYLENCDIYNDTFETSCKQCTETSLVKLSNTSYRCLQKLESQNCENLNTTEIQNNQYKCEKCKSGYYTSNATDIVNPVSFCVPYYKIENCLIYDTNTQYSTNTSKCIQCEEGFHVSMYGFNCVQRSGQIQNCIAYENNSMNCQQCSEGYYISTDKKSCLEYPKGVQYCIQYQSLTQCSTCLENYYLKEGQCVLVPDESKVENCIEYNQELNCVRCNSNYYQNNEGKCALPEAQNCATYESPTLCASCKSSMVFEQDQDTGLRNCVSLEIFKCEYINPETKKCEKCGQGYYVKEDGTCALAQDISFCMKYLSETQCSQCEENFYLSEDKTQCFRPDDKIQISPLCKYNIYQEDPECVWCKQGYYFSSEGCLACKDSSCAICDFNDPALCQVCKSGYYQQESHGRCLENPKQEVEIVKGVLIDKILVSMILLISVLIQIQFFVIYFSINLLCELDFFYGIF